MNEVGEDFVTPHEAWGKPCAMGPVRVLWVGAPGEQYRLISEIAQRFDMPFEAVVCYGGPDAPGSTDSYMVRAEGNTPPEKKAELVRKLAKDYDVIVLSWPFKDLPPAARYQIVNKIVHGAGFIGELDKGMFDPAAQPLEPNLDFLLHALPVSPPGAPTSSGTGISAAAFGKGRWLRGGASFAETGDPWRDALICDLNCMSWANRLLWLAGKSPRFSVEYATAQGQTSGQAMLADAKYSFTVEPTPGAPPRYHVRFRLKDESAETRIEMSAEGEGARAFSFPLLAPGKKGLPAGKYYVDVRISSDAGKEYWATRSIEVRSPYALTVRVDSPSVRKGEPVLATVSLQDPADPKRPIPAPGRTDLEVQTIDGYGRVASFQVVPFPAASSSVPLRVPNTHPACIGHRLVVTLRQDGVPMCRAEGEFFVPRDPWERFPSVLWPTGVNGQYFSWLNDCQSRRAGFTHYLGGESFKTARRLAFADLGIAPIVLHIQLDHNKDGWTTNWLQPQFSSGVGMGEELKDGEATIFRPAVQEMYRRMATKLTDEVKMFRPFCYNLGDENRFSYDGGFSPHEIRAFREFLQREYGTLAHLNETWGRQFRSWDEIDGPSVKSAVAEETNYPAKHDRQSFMEYQYVMFHHLIGGFLQERDPGAAFGLEGSSGGDLELMLTKARLFCPYADRGHNALVMSFAPDLPHLIRGNWWGGYSGGGGRQLGTENLWSQIISGFSNSSWWFTQNSIEGFISVDLGYAEYFSDRFLNGLLEIGDGVGQQLNEYRLVDDGVAIHTSAASSHVGSYFPAFGNSARTLLELLDRIGVSARYISDRQILAGQLAWPGRKVLFMPASHAVGLEEARRIIEFVEQGGTVVAGFAPGMCNEHAKPLPKGYLDDLFGIVRQGPPNLVQTPLQWDGLRCASTKADDHVVPSPGTESQGSGKAPMGLFRESGRGCTLLLNFDLLAANGSLDPRCGTNFETVLDTLLRGVRPLCHIQGSHARLAVFPKPGTTLIGVLSGSAQETGATIDLGATRHVYDVRAGKSLGAMAALRFNPSSARSFLFAIQEKPMGSITVTVRSPGRIGGVIRGRVDLDYRPARGESRVIRIETHDPLGNDRRELRLYPRTDRRKVDFEIPVAWNDPPGSYRVRAVDILTGSSGEVTVNVAAGAK